jgi:hypothetical protein
VNICLFIRQEDEEHTERRCVQINTNTQYGNGNINIEAYYEKWWAFVMKFKNA